MIGKLCIDLVLHDLLVLQGELILLVLLVLVWVLHGKLILEVMVVLRRRKCIRNRNRGASTSVMDWSQDAMIAMLTL